MKEVLPQPQKVILFFVPTSSIRAAQSHLKYDICRHYDTRSMKKAIMDEMATNQKRIDAATKSTDWKQKN